LSKHKLEEINNSKFPTHTNDTHQKQANAWLKLENATGQKKFVKQHGAQWSVLNKLLYWKPINYCSIKLMHAFGKIKQCGSCHWSPLHPNCKT
jgi:hypothetical protein